jgi:hypothetical protein
VQLDVQLDCQLILGRLRTARGARFVGWLGVVDASSDCTSSSAIRRHQTKGAGMTSSAQESEATLVVGGTGKTERRLAVREQIAR